jgi:FMN-dependent oxidoreductase (nitrilotriacetate monooxygenase family)
LLDPMPMLAQMARVTKHIGLGGSVSTSFVHPFQTARTFATLDHLSGGRMAWNIVTTSSRPQWANFGQEPIPRDERYDVADEVVEACTRLWDSWEPDALVMDKATGRFADASKVHRVDYRGKYVSTRGPLTVPRTTQGWPVLMQAGSSPRGREFAGRWAEIIFTLQHSIPDMRAFRADIHARMEKRGRRPEECQVLVSVDPIVGETRGIAEEKAAYLNGLIDPELGLALVSAHIGTDLSHYPLHQPLQDVETSEGSRGSFDVILQGTRSEGLTLGDAARRFAVSELCPQVVGTPSDIADQLQAMFDSGGCDGFVLTPTTFPGCYEQFARSVVPELQRRDLMRVRYEGRTLRENLRT